MNLLTTFSGLLRERELVQALVEAQILTKPQLDGGRIHAIFLKLFRGQPSVYIPHLLMESYLHFNQLNPKRATEFLIILGIREKANLRRSLRGETLLAKKRANNG